MPELRVMVSGGGTGGHVYPALAVVAALPAVAGRKTEVLYVGSKRGMERDLVQKAGLDFAGIQAGPLRGRSIFETAGNIVRLGIGLIESLALIRRHRPGAILATGGYVCTPVVVAGWLLGVPGLIYLPDVRPGWAVKFLSRFARAIAVTSETSKEFLSASKVIETGYPVRPGIMRADKAEARRRLGLSDGLPVLLALGGSRGAHSINTAVEKALPDLLRFWQLVHVCGHEDAEWLKEARDRLDEAARRQYHLYPYMYEEMPDALAAADLALSRSGASVLGEYPAAGLPSILVPYPYAGGHQRLNARVLAAANAAVLLENDRLGELASVVNGLLAEKARLAEMAAKAKQKARPEAAADIARILMGMGVAQGAAS